MIEEAGTLNSKAEFGMNHLCRMVVEENPWKVEESNKNLEKSKRKNKQDLHEFISVMKSVAGYNILQHDEDIIKNNKKMLLFFQIKPQKEQSCPGKTKIFTEEEEKSKD